MLVDTDEYDNVDERSDTAIINPQQLDEDVDELEQEPLASDCTDIFVGPYTFSGLTVACRS